MKPSAAMFVTILFAVAAIILVSPAEAGRKKDTTPNDLACFGVWQMCSGLCQAKHPNDDAAWGDCMKTCGDDVRICRARDNIAMTAGSLSSSNGEIFDPNKPGGTDGGTGSFGGDGTANLNNAGMSAGGGVAPIY